MSGCVFPVRKDGPGDWSSCKGLLLEIRIGVLLLRAWLFCLGDLAD